MSEPFNISTNDIQMGTLYLNDLKTNDALRKISFDAEDLINIIKEEFVPFLMDKDSQYKFPQRTVINDNGDF